MVQEELASMMAAEEQRLGVGNKEFMQRHNEIIQMVEEASQKGANQMVCAALDVKCEDVLDYERMERYKKECENGQ